MQALNLTFSPISYIVLAARETWWQWAYRNLMKTNPCSPDIHEQIHKLYELAQKKQKIVQLWNGK